MRPPTTPGQSEEQDQILLVNWFARTYPEAAPCLHHSPNGGERSARTGHRMKLMGTRPGFHDLILFWPVGSHTGLVLELKFGRGQLSQAQRDWIPRYQACGFATRQCWGFEAARNKLAEYMAGGME